MRKSSKVLLALVTGVAVGTVLAYAIKTVNEENTTDIFADNEMEPNKLDNIAKQFSEKISDELKTAETKIKGAVKNAIDGLHPEKEIGLFL